ncbi:UxaA family hydrolase [Allopusillimonas soli]|uniref:UxaA family hydrolase n=1 Tax=Allopusillimonas soli TaxID=659016 RepID=UPI001ADB1EF9|nr:UxaA family hydrolase [Allopusillimonas soli]
MTEKAAIQIRDEDQVATAITELLPGESVKIRGVRKEYEIQVMELIPTGHKIALRDIAHNEEILKYGEVIGAATTAIPAGHHVHMHNCFGLKARRFSGPSKPGESQDA